MEGLGVVEARVLDRSRGRRQEGLGRFGSLADSSGAGLALGAVDVGPGPAASSAAVRGTTWDR